MLRKLLVVLVLAVLALVAHDNGRRISEANVHAHFREQMQALAAFDSEAICKAMAADYGVRSVEHAGGAVLRQTWDRTTGCGQMKDAVALMQVIHNQTGGMLGIDFSYEITRIEIAPGGRRATVESVATARIAGRLLSRTRSKSELSRAWWHVRDHGGQTQTWNYAG